MSRAAASPSDPRSPLLAPTAAVSVATAGVGDGLRPESAWKPGRVLGGTEEDGDMPLLTALSMSLSLAAVGGNGRGDPEARPPSRSCPLSCVSCLASRAADAGMSPTGA